MSNNLKFILKLFGIFALLLVIYMFLIQIWNSTSDNYKPVGLFDHITRTGPTDISDWTDNRRMHD